MASKPPSTGIPTFGLYGESNTRQSTEFIHIEDISTRSQQHDWQIKPHRHGKLFQVLFLFDGAVTLSLNEQQIALNGNWAISIPPGHVHGFHFPADTQGLVLTIVDSLLHEPYTPVAAYSFEALLQIPHTIHFQEKQSLFIQLKQYLQLIQGEFYSVNTGQSQMLQWLVNMVLMTLKRQLEYDLRETQQPDSPNPHLLMRFRALLDEHYRQHWSVQNYAEALHVSTSTLTRLCKTHTGSTAKALILERTLLEIKRRLIYTNEPLDRMADTLGFKDPAYFSRYFKKQEGITLSQYRTTKNRETGTVTN